MMCLTAGDKSFFAKFIAKTSVLLFEIIFEGETYVDGYVVLESLFCQIYCEDNKQQDDNHA